MSKRTGVSDRAFLELFEKYGGAETARRMGCNVRNVFQRRRIIEKRTHRPVIAPTQQAHVSLFRPDEYPWEINLQVENGIVLIASDAHYWPGKPSLMHRAFVTFCKERKPKAVILNGDVIDGARISRHPPIGFPKTPELKDEIEAAKKRLAEIEAATFKARKIWPLGNHDERFSTNLATHAREYAEIHGTSLNDHFPNWESCWSCVINGSVLVKHSFKGGEHAPFNNTIRSGKTTITGHLHKAHVRPYTDLNGTRYGVDTGILADVDHRAFVDYSRNNPKDWRAGFCVLTFKGSLLLQPELVLKWNDESVQFRGEIIRP